MATHRVLYFRLVLSVLVTLAACSQTEQVDGVFLRTGRRHVRTLPKMVGGATKMAGKALDAMQAHHHIKDDILGAFTLKSLSHDDNNLFSQESDVQSGLTGIVGMLVRYDRLLEAVRYDELALRRPHIAGKVRRARAAGQAVLSRLRQTAKNMHCGDIGNPDDQTSTHKTLPWSRDRQFHSALVMYKYRGFMGRLGDYVTGLCMTSCARCG
ncbi:uncharacterized protein LOC144926230 [Branchiostoma floridae x Branchiostoma belcheri]